MSKYIVAIILWDTSEDRISGDIKKSGDVVVEDVV